MNNKRLLAIHEYHSLGYGFDYCNFLLSAEIERVQNGCSQIDIAFVRQNSGLDNVKESIYELNARHFYYNIVSEITRLMHSVGNTYTYHDRNQLLKYISAEKDKYICFPSNYLDLVAEGKPQEWLTTVLTWNRHPDPEISQHSSFSDLRASTQQINLIRKWIKNNVYPKIPITVTLRESESRKTLNSHIGEWQKLINSYLDKDYIFIVLRDYSKLYEPPVLKGTNVIHFNEPVTSVSLRSALYQESSLNLFVANGPAIIALYNKDARYIIFSNICIQLDININYGAPDKSIKYKQIICEGDTYKIMKPEVDFMFHELHNNHDLIPSYYSASDTNVDFELPDGNEIIDISSTDKYFNLFTPSYLKRKVNPAVSKWVSEKRKVLIYGAGFHTDYLFKWTTIEEVNIIGLVDKDEHKQGRKYYDYNITGRDQIKNLDPDIILISTNQFQDEIYAEIKYLEDRGIEIFRIYNN